MLKSNIQNAEYLQIKEENARLKRAVEELSILNDLAREISASLDSQEIIKKIIHRSTRSVNTEQGMITLVDSVNHDMMKTLIRDMVSSSDHVPYHLDQALLGWMYLNKSPLKLNNPQKDDRFRGINWDGAILNLLSVPLLVKSKLIGILTVLNKRDRQDFNDNDLRLLSIIAAQSSQVVENARLYEKEQALLKINEELRFANEIQMGLLPASNPKLPGYDIAGVSIPAQSVGGDYFDFIAINKGKLAVCLGDVSGKGLPAALLMANLQATIRGQSLDNCNPEECLRRSNRLLHNSTSPEKFATFFYGVLDYINHLLTFANAGHDRPILFKKKGDIQILDQAGIALSFVKDFPYKQDSLNMEKNEILIIYSDGITEAMNIQDEEFGEKRVVDIITRNMDKSSNLLIDILIKSIREHTGSREQFDDMTVIIIKRLD